MGTFFVRKTLSLHTDPASVPIQHTIHSAVQTAVHTDRVCRVSQCVYHCVHTDRVYCVSQCVYHCVHCLCSDGGSESVEEEDEEETPALPTASGNPWLTHKGVGEWVGG